MLRLSFAPFDARQRDVRLCPGRATMERMLMSSRSEATRAYYVVHVIPARTLSEKLGTDLSNQDTKVFSDRLNIDLKLDQANSLIYA